MTEAKASRLAGLATGLAVGLLLGATFGGLEMGLFLVTKGQGTIPRLDVLAASLMYGLFWALAGGASGLLAGLLPQRLGLVAAERWRRVLGFGTFLLAGMVYVDLFAHANVHWNATPFAPKSFLVDAALLLAVGAVALGLWFAVRALHARFSGLGKLLAAACASALLVLAVVALVPAKASQGLDKVESQGEQPNVIVMLVDTLRADHLGVWGYHRDTSPNLDRFAQDAVRFERCISQSSTTPPSTVSLLTSLHPPTHNHGQLLSVLPAGVPMMPDGMGAYGYDTAFVSTNPLVSKSYGYARQVDYYRGTQAQGSYLTNLYHALTLARKFEDRLLHLGWGPVLGYLQIWRGLNATLHPGDFQDDAGWVNDQFLAWIDQQPREPFFAYLHYMEPHEPYEPLPPYDTMFERGDYDGPHLRHPPKTVAAHPPVMTSTELDDAGLHHIVAQYDGEIADWDNQFGLFLDELRQRGLYDDTAIVIIADHGEEFFEHKTWGHGHSLFQEVIHVPLLVKLPGSQQAGLEVAGQVRSVDVLPTLFDLAGVEPWPGLQGSSLMPVIESGAVGFEGHEAYSEIHSRGYTGRSYIAGDDKVMEVRLDASHWYQFDLSSDPTEQDIPDAGSPDVGPLQARLEQVYEQLRVGVIEDSEAGLAPDMEEQLRQLGYIE